MFLSKKHKLIGLMGIITMVVLIVVGFVWKGAQKEDPALTVISEKRDFKVNEDTEFEFKYIKSKRELVGSIQEALNLSDYWEEIDIIAELEDSKGKKVDISPEISLENNGEFSVKLKKPRVLKPGVYKMMIRIEDESGDLKQVKEIEQEFSWGVLAINTNKSIYVVEADSSGLTRGDNAEVAYIQMAALDSEGHTICDANLVLSIKYNKPVASLPVIASQLKVSGIETVLSTEDGTIKKSSECGPKSITNVPDYYAYYQIGEVGKYQITLTNLAAGYKITDSFEVRESVPFDVERIGPTRIYPPAGYEMTIKVGVNQDFRGQIKESVPANFKIIKQELRIKNRESGEYEIQDTKYEIQDTGNGEKALVWQDVFLKEGDTLELRYTFNAPDISPYFYLLGPLIFEQ